MFNSYFSDKLFTPLLSTKMLEKVYFINKKIHLHLNLKNTKSFRISYFYFKYFTSISVFLSFTFASWLSFTDLWFFSDSFGSIVSILKFLDFSTVLDGKLTDERISHKFGWFVFHPLQKCKSNLMSFEFNEGKTCRLFSFEWL